MKFQDKLLSFKGEEKRPLPQTSLFIKLSAFAILLILIVSSLWTLIFIKREKDILYRDKVNSANMVLTHFASKAALPLMEEDMIALNTLVKEAREVEGFLYAMILDSTLFIKAHTDPAKIGAFLKEFENIENLITTEAVTTLTYRLPSGTRVLNLSKPIAFMNKKIGSVSVGLNLDFVNHEIKKEMLKLIKKVLWISVTMLIAGIGAAFFLTKWVDPSEKQGNALFPEAIRNQVAVLYTGIREFKTYAGSRNPEGVFQDLSEYFSIATKGVLDHGGYVIRVAGDTVVGIFQSSPLKEDHIHRAVRGAVAIQKALEFEKQQGSQNSLLGKVGIGISSGVVLFGDIGSHAGKKNNYIGERFKAASSLYALAGPGEIVISKEVYKSIEHSVAVDPLPPREMTQRTEAWESFRLRNIVEREPHV